MIPMLDAQQKVVQYNRDFEFKSGLYLNFAAFQHNDPIPPSRIRFDSNRNDKDFMGIVMDQASLIYEDAEGKEVEIKTNSAWGYTSNGSVYINHGTGYCRINVIGAICHFVALVQVRLGVQDPFYYDSPFGVPQDRYTYTSQQMVMNFENGAIFSFDVSAMEILLKPDDELYKEFSSLSKRKKRDGIFLYMRKFNEKHPIYFPE